MAPPVSVPSTSEESQAGGRGVSTEPVEEPTGDDEESDEEESDEEESDEEEEEEKVEPKKATRPERKPLEPWEIPKSGQYYMHDDRGASAGPTDRRGSSREDRRGRHGDRGRRRENRPRGAGRGERYNERPGARDGHGGRGGRRKFGEVHGRKGEPRWLWEEDNEREWAHDMFDKIQKEEEELGAELPPLVNDVSTQRV